MKKLYARISIICQTTSLQEVCFIRLILFKADVWICTFYCSLHRTLGAAQEICICKTNIEIWNLLGANVKEAQNAESKANFIHKMKIALKEADGTEYWLKLCSELDSYPKPIGMTEKLESIIKILNKIIGTSKRTANIR